MVYFPHRLEGSLKNFGQDHREVVALYLFGSEATGRTGPLSDLDLAVLLDESKVKPRRRLDAQLNLLAETMRASGRFDVDLVLLNEATPLLAYEVVRSGRLLFERDRQKRITFEANAVCRYLDLEPFYQVSRKYLKRQLLHPKTHG